MSGIVTGRGPAAGAARAIACAPPLAALAALLLLVPPALASSPPVVSTGASSPGAASWLRTLEGAVASGGFKVRECSFEYDTVPYAGEEGEAHGAAVPCAQGTAAEIGTGAAPVPVSAETEPLDPATTYHYRLVAENALGAAYGADRSFTTGSASAGSCPNEARRLEQGIAALLLPDCMALEMVSPPQKQGQSASIPNVSVDGSRVNFKSPAPLGEDPPPALNVSGSLYVASRGGSGWTTERTLPDADLKALWEDANARGEPRASFMPDFSRWLGIGATHLQYEQGIGRAFEAGLGGFLRWLSAPLVPLTFDEGGGGKRNGIVAGTRFQGASADHSHLYFRPGEGSRQPTTYLPGDPRLSGLGLGGQEVANTYLARLGAGGSPALELLQRDRGEKFWGGQCGARLGGIGDPFSGPAANGNRNQGAISADGSLTYLSARAAQPQSGECEESNELRILKRLETPSGPEISELIESECSRVSPPCASADGDDLYQGASLDQTKVYLTTNRQLADTDLDGSGAECSLTAAVPGCDLYLYDAARPAGERLIQASAGEATASHPTAGSGAGVYNGITAISADGSRAYFVATGVLTEDPSPAGETATGGAPNLYMFDEGAWEEAGEEGGLSFLGTLDSSDAITQSGGASIGLWGGQGTWLNDAYPVPALSAAERRGEGDAEEGGDGHVLVFETHASLTPEDADGGYLDVYRYDAQAGTLACISCAPGSSAAAPDEGQFGVQPRGKGGVPGTDFAEFRRWASEDGEDVVFETRQGLLPGDRNGGWDAYLWRGGALYRLPGGGSTTFAEGYVALSPEGSTVAFTSAKALLPRDGDDAGDVYVARVGGGFPEQPQQQLCQGEECRGEPSAAPQLAGAGSAAFQGAGNPPALRDCRAPARRAARLSRGAKRLRARARTLTRRAHRTPGPRRTRRLGRRVRRLAGAARRRAKLARRLARQTRRCRRANRRRTR